jgi:WXG100 family type VII secretion target
MANTIDPQEFEVDLKEMSAAISQFKGQSGQVKDLLVQLGTVFDAVKTAWQSPAGTTHAEVHDWFKKSSSDLHDLFEEALQKLNNAYDNYRGTEQTNTTNLESGDGGGGGGNSGQHHKTLVSTQDNGGGGNSGAPTTPLLRREGGIAPTTPALKLELKQVGSS